MSGIPASLLKKLKQTLLDCGPFGGQRTLISVFADDRISPWKNQVSDADTRRDRVDLFVSDFLDRKNSAGQNVLVLFLQAVFDQAEDVNSRTLMYQRCAANVYRKTGALTAKR